MKSFVLFNNKGGVGKTTLTFNMAHMLARNGSRTVVLDFDPQSNVKAEQPANRDGSRLPEF